MQAGGAEMMPAGEETGLSLSSLFLAHVEEGLVLGEAARKAGQHRCTFRVPNH